MICSSGWKMKQHSCLALALCSLLLLATSVQCVSLLPPVSGGLKYGPCHYPSDSTVETGGPRAQPNQGVEDPSTLREFCPNAVVNGITEACRVHWINRARDLQFNGAVNTANLHCPLSMYAAVLVDHTDGSPLNEVVDGVNCGVLVAFSNGKAMAGPTLADSPESEIIRELASRFTVAQITNRIFWNKFTMYSTAEPSAAVASQLVNVGIGGIVYGIRTGELLEFGYPVVAIRSLDILQRQPTYQLTRRSTKTALTTVLIGQVGRDSLAVHFGWPYNDTMPCPEPCQPYRGNSAHGYRCRGYSTTTTG